MNLIEIYYYLFYKFYKLFEAIGPKNEQNDTRAVIGVISLELWIFLSLEFYYNVIVHNNNAFEVYSVKFLIPFLVILLLKWFAFWRNDKWKNYVKEFDQWPQERNRKGSWIVAFVSLFLLSNLILSIIIYQSNL